MALAEQLATLLEQGRDQPRHRADAATELRRLRAEADQLRAEADQLRAELSALQARKPLTILAVLDLMPATIPASMDGDLLLFARAIERTCAAAWGVTLVGATK